MEVAPGARIVDSAHATAQEVVAGVGSAGGADPGRAPELHLYVTDGAERFVELARRILGEQMTRVELVDVA